MAIQTRSDSGYDQEAWDLLTRFSLRPELHFDSVTTVKATKQDKPGHTVRFTFTNDLAVATTPLSETVDTTPVNWTDSTVDLALAEYGNTVKTTAFLRGTSFIPLDPVTAHLIGYNAGLSFDTLARDALLAGTNVTYPGAIASRVTVAAGSTMNSSLVRKNVALLRNANVPTIGGFYIGYLNPDQSVDLRVETGGVGWRDPQNAVTVQGIINGEIGTFEGVRWIETSRMPKLADAGVGGTVDVYQGLILGWEALACAYSETVAGRYPAVFPGPVTDHLLRFVPMSWYWLGVFKILRQEAVRRIETSSTLGTN